MASTHCVSCPIGKVPEYQFYTCTECEEEEVSLDGLTCTTCPDGLGPNEEQTACVGCVGDQFYDLSIKGCRSCDAGTEFYYNVETRASTCRRCQGGYAKPGMEGRCEFCGVGKYSSAERSQCFPCPTGTISEDAVECVPCPDGELPNAAQSACITCAGNKFYDNELRRCAFCP